MNTKFTKAICAAAVITVTACAAVTTDFSGYAEAARIDDSVSIHNIVINNATNSLSRSGNTMNCTERLQGWTCYRAAKIRWRLDNHKNVVVYRQHKNGNVKDALRQQRIQIPSENYPQSL